MAHSAPLGRLTSPGREGGRQSRGLAQLCLQMPVHPETGAPLARGWSSRGPGRPPATLPPAGGPQAAAVGLASLPLGATQRPVCLLSLLLPLDPVSLLPGCRASPPSQPKRWKGSVQSTSQGTEAPSLGGPDWGCQLGAAGAMPGWGAPDSFLTAFVSSSLRKAGSAKR